MTDKDKERLQRRHSLNRRVKQRDGRVDGRRSAGVFTEPRPDLTQLIK